MSDRLTLNWSGRHCLVWAGGKTRMRNVTLDSSSEDDISVVMQNRAKTGSSRKYLTPVALKIFAPGYGSHVNMAEVGQLGAESEELRLAWAWLQHATDLVTSGQLRSHLRSYSTHPQSIWIQSSIIMYFITIRSGQVRVPGVRAILRSGGSSSSEARLVSFRYLLRITLLLKDEQ